MYKGYLNYDMNKYIVLSETINICVYIVFPNERNKLCISAYIKLNHISTVTALPAKSDSEVMFCLQIYQGYRIDRSRVY